MKYPRYYVNTDSVDIQNRQIGVHAHGCNDREFCITVNHKGTRESVEEATRIARLMVIAPELLEELKHLYQLLKPALDDGVRIPGLATVNKLSFLIEKAEK